MRSMPGYVTATKIMADSESPTLVSYKFSKEALSLSRTIFELFTVFIYNGISHFGPENGGLGSLPLKST